MSENPIYHGRSSRKIYLPLYFLAILLLIITIWLIIANTFTLKTILPAAFFALIILKVTEIHRLGHYYEINPRSVVHTKGYLKKHSRRIDLFAISDIIVKQTTYQRIFGFGDVIIRLFAIDTQNILKNVNDPKKFVMLIEEAVAEARSSPSAVQTPHPQHLNTHQNSHSNTEPDYPSSDNFEEIFE